MSVAKSRREQATLDLIQQALKEGRVPSADEIMSALAQLNAVNPLDELDKEPVSFPGGSKISSKRMNKAIDIIHDELSGVLSALGDAWNTMSSLLDDSETLVSQAEEAKKIAGEARRMLSLTDNADTYNVARALSLGSISEFDTVNSDDVFIDINAKTMRLAATDITFKPIDATFVGVYRGSLVDPTSFSQVGAVTAVTKAGYANRHIVQVPSTDDTDSVSLVYDLSLTTQAGPDSYKFAEAVSVVEIDTQSTYDMHVMAETSYDGFNWEELGQAWGNNKVVVMGPSRKATNVRLTLRKIRSDNLIAGSGSLRYGYVFDTSQVRVGISSFEKTGHMFSNPIEISGSGIASVLIDAKIDRPEGTDVEVYVAEDVAGSDPDTLSWKKITLNDRMDISVRSPYNKTLSIKDPAKYLDGVGSLFDLWIADVEDDKLVSLDCGLDQATLRVGVDSVNSVVMTPYLAAGAQFDDIRVRSLKSEISLTGNTVYRLEFSVWADAECSTSIGLQSGAPSKTMICVNDGDVTNAWSRDEVSINLPQGRSRVAVIVVSGTDTWVKIVPPTGFLSAIERPVVKDHNMILEGEMAAAQHDGKVLVNFDPNGMLVSMSLLNETNSSTGTIRTKFILETSNPTTSPTVTDIYVVAGV